MEKPLLGAVLGIAAVAAVGALVGTVTPVGWCCSGGRIDPIGGAIFYGVASFVVLGLPGAMLGGVLGWLIDHEFLSDRPDAKPDPDPLA